MIVRDSFLYDGSINNRSIVNVTRGNIRHDWRGPCLIMAKKGLSRNPSPYTDLDIGVFPDVIDFFVVHGNNPSVIRPTEGPREVQAVRISCKGDMKVFGSDKYLPVTISKDNPIFRGPGEISGISRRVGLPLGVLKLPMDNGLARDKHGLHYENSAVTFLLMGDDPSPETEIQNPFERMGWG